MTGTHRTEETKRKIGAANSVIISQLYLDGGMSWSKGHYLSSKTKRDCYYRSSWELRYMKQLDEDQNVAWWEYEPLRIPYEFEGNPHHYVPDFVVTYIDGRRELQEMGREYTKSTLPIGAAKSQAGREWAQKNGLSFRLVSFEGTT